MSYHKKYTLDRFDGDYAIFLQHPEETKQLLIHRDEMDLALKEGDIVAISDNGRAYEITILNEETNNQKQRIQQLMKQLRERNR